ncbi:hypothetical protein Pcinc_032841 [Petrolisthes cinctipes]|uniref:Uncharacterized protein n=1 Tax=Petrolisthes cinctipes TaxID=88211 RepID=A0AAE1K2E4_PETCI|nr:hypothetical protein Pcinc_032841 [Petrolisthes cinctipes]
MASADSPYPHHINTMKSLIWLVCVLVGITATHAQTVVYTFTQFPYKESVTNVLPVPYLAQSLGLVMSLQNHPKPDSWRKFGRSMRWPVPRLPVVWSYGASTTPAVYVSVSHHPAILTSTPMMSLRRARLTYACHHSRAAFSSA